MNLVSKEKIFDYVYAMAGTLFLILMIFTCDAFTNEKTLLILTLSLTAFIEIISKKIKVRTNHVYCLIFFICFFFLSLFYGILNGYQFNLSIDKGLIQTWIFTPIIIFLLYSVLNKNEKRKEFLFSLITILTLFLVIFDLAKQAQLLKIFPKTSLLDFVRISSDHISDEKLDIRIANEHSFMFLLPIYIVLYFKNNQLLKRILYSIITLGGFVYCILSGRKALELVILGSFIINLIINIKNITTNSLKKIIFALIISILFITTIHSISSSININSIFSSAWKTLFNGLNIKAKGVTKRTNNTIALINLWFKSPLWGNGLNSYAKNSLASSRTKWSYEVIYVALLAQTGLIGFGLFFGIIYYICRKLYLNYKIYKDIKSFAILNGFISFIICGATNPLVYYLWPWVIALTFTRYIPELDNKDKLELK